MHSAWVELNRLRDQMCCQWTCRLGLLSEYKTITLIIDRIWPWNVPTHLTTRSIFAVDQMNRIYHAHGCCECVQTNSLIDLRNLPHQFPFVQNRPPVYFSLFSNHPIPIPVKFVMIIELWISEKKLCFCFFVCHHHCYYLVFTFVAAVDTAAKMHTTWRAVCERKPLFEFINILF